MVRCDSPHDQGAHQSRRYPQSYEHDAEAQDYGRGVSSFRGVQVPGVWIGADSDLVDVLHRCHTFSPSRLSHFVGGGRSGTKRFISQRERSESGPNNKQNKNVLLSNNEGYR